MSIFPFFIPLLISVDITSGELIFEVIQNDPFNTASFKGLSEDIAIVDIPSSVTNSNGKTYTVIEIKEQTCQDNDSIEKLKIPKTIQTIRQYAFRNSKKIRTLTFEADSNLEHVEDLALDLLTSLEQCILPQRLRHIGSWCFASAYLIREWKIPASVETIGTGAFTYLSSLERFTVDENNRFFKTFNDALYSKDFKRLLSVPGKQESVEICDMTEIICPRCITGNTIKNVKLPYMLRIIYSDALIDWGSPNSLTYCGPNFFKDVLLKNNKPQLISTVFSPYITNFGLSVNRSLEYCELNTNVPLPAYSKIKICNKKMLIGYLLLLLEGGF